MKIILEQKKPITKTMASLRTLVLELLRLMEVKNNVAQLELFQDNFEQLITVLKDIGFYENALLLLFNNFSINIKNL